MGRMKKISQVGSYECSDLLPWPHSLLLVSKQREKKKKTLDNHQCLQYLSSKRLKAHIAYNWIWFALPASVREIKGKHKNPHDSFSSRWQARPNRSWKEYLWRKPSRLLAQRLLEMTVLGNNEHIIKTWIIMGVLRTCLMFFPASKWEGKVVLSVWNSSTWKLTTRWNDSLFLTE